MARKNKKIEAVKSYANAGKVFAGERPATGHEFLVVLAAELCLIHDARACQLLGLPFCEKGEMANRANGFTDVRAKWRERVIEWLNQTNGE